MQTAIVPPRETRTINGIHYNAGEVYPVIDPEDIEIIEQKVTIQKEVLK